jgi:hypothetical protein
MTRCALACDQPGDGGIPSPSLEIEQVAPGEQWRRGLSDDYARLGSNLMLR